MYICNETIDKLVQESRKNTRKRSHLLLHETSEDKIQSMLFGLQPLTKIRAHRHSNETETICSIKGQIAIFFFNDSGEVIDRRLLNQKNIIYKFNPKVWHSYVCLEEDTVGWEIKEGPYLPGKVQFAQWCPEENDSNFIFFQQQLIDLLEVSNEEFKDLSFSTSHDGE
ncbi:WbuC family cupin fold metalloprotein [Halobacillus sp. BBL2006]|uniref:WbuC family cupin fold metalloprotein n=1 Tax=Halobacillus sp. BBL2006 TaxID=1543706 RepID=UPI000542E144|nr:WbuC family cupin fold metalloprotein [Halobacillus sp. BBL2006]KHE69242.1 hypothetical protein LD39_13245 [Halobacillus sp. BBL2006]